MTSVVPKVPRFIPADETPRKGGGFSTDHKTYIEYLVIQIIIKFFVIAIVFVY